MTLHSLSLADLNATVPAPPPPAVAPSADWTQFHDMLKAEITRNEAATSAQPASKPPPAQASTVTTTAPATAPAAQADAGATAKGTQTEHKTGTGTDTAVAKAAAPTDGTKTASAAQDQPAPAKTGQPAAAAIQTATTAGTAAETQTGTPPSGSASASLSGQDTTTPATSATSDAPTDPAAATAVATTTTETVAAAAETSAPAISGQKSAAPAVSTKPTDSKKAAAAVAANLIAVPLVLPTPVVLAASQTSPAHTLPAQTAAVSSGSPTPSNAAALTSGFEGTGESGTTSTAMQPQSTGSSPGNDQTAGDQQQSGPPQSEGTEDAPQSGPAASAQGSSGQQNIAPLVAQLQTATAATVPATLTAAMSAHTVTGSGEKISVDPGLGTGSGLANTATITASLSGSPGSASTPAATSAAFPYAASQQLAPTDQVALAIGRLTNGARSFSLQLQPEQLGAVDVRMDVDAKGKAKVSISADRPETLALLKQDSHQLVKALQDAGVTTDQTVVSFSLRDPGAGTGQDRRQGQGSAAKPVVTADDADATPESVPVRSTLSRHLYDIRA